MYDLRIERVTFYSNKYSKNAAPKKWGKIEGQK